MAPACPSRSRTDLLLPWTRQPASFCRRRFISLRAKRIGWSSRRISGFDNDAEEVVVGPSEVGSVSRPDYWEYTPPAAVSFTLSITVKDKSGATRASTSRPVVVSPVRTGNNIRHLSIGDSITRAGGYADQAVQCILGGKTVGIRTY